MNDQDEIARLKGEIAQLQAQLKAQSAPAELTSLRENHELLTDLARYAEDILSDHDIKKKYHFDNATWTRLCTDERFIEKIEAEKIRRTRSGITARERAQVLFAAAPMTLGAILNNDKTPVRNRIEAAREIRAVAATGADAIATSEERFVIRIDLGQDHKLVIDQPIRPTPGNDDNTIDGTAQELFPMATMKNRG